MPENDFTLISVSQINNNNNSSTDSDNFLIKARFSIDSGNAQLSFVNENENDDDVIIRVDDLNTCRLFKLSSVELICINEGVESSKKETSYSKAITIQFRTEDESELFHLSFEQWKTEAASAGSANKKGKSVRTKNFSMQEDEHICRAWVAISEDPMVATLQSKHGIWDRIYENFKMRVGPGNNRSKDSVSSRWGHIQRAVHKFFNIVSSIERMTTSGSTNQDWFNDAKTTYALTYSAQFIFDHCWAILKDSSKWNEALGTRTSSSKKRGSTSDLESSSNTTTPPIPAHGDPVSLGEGSDMFEANANKSTEGSDMFEENATKSTDGPIRRKKEKLNQMECREESQHAMDSYMSQIVALAEERKADVAVKLEANRLKKWKEDNKILAQDLSVLDPDVADHFKVLKREILQVREAERVFSR